MGLALSISTDERRARLAVRHRLVPSARVNDDLIAIEHIGSARAAEVGAAAACLEEQLGDIRVVPRFPTPTDKALSR